MVTFLMFLLLMTISLIAHLLRNSSRIPLAKVRTPISHSTIFCYILFHFFKLTSFTLHVYLLFSFTHMLLMFDVFFWSIFWWFCLIEWAFCWIHYSDNCWKWAEGIGVARLVRWWTEHFGEWSMFSLYVHTFYQNVTNKTHNDTEFDIKFWCLKFISHLLTTDYFWFL